MRTWRVFLSLLTLLVALSACGGPSGVPDAGGPPAVEQTPAGTVPSPSAGGIDVDLTQLSSTMVYSEVYNMMMYPEQYVGKQVKMKGRFSVYEDKSTGNLYFAVVISDAAACCAQGIEFVWEGEHTYPRDYPEPGTEITVVGGFQTYEENGISYCRLTDADFI